MSKAALYRMTYALIMLDGTFTCSLTIGCKGYSPAQNCRNTAFFRVQLRTGTEQRFADMTGMKLKKPQSVHVDAVTEITPRKEIKPDAGHGAGDEFGGSDY